jgi:K+ transporter
LVQNEKFVLGAFVCHFIIKILFTVINGAKLVQVSKSGEVDARGMIVIVASGILFLAMFGYYLARQIVANLKETTREISPDEYITLTGETPNFVDNLVIDCDKYTKTKQVTNGLNMEGLFAKNYVFLEMLEYNEPNHFHLKKEKMSQNTTKFHVEYGFKDNLDLNKILQKELTGSIHYASFNYKLKNATGFEGLCLNIYVLLEKLAFKFDYKFNVKKHQLNDVEIIVD